MAGILSLDLSLTGTGWVYYDAQGRVEHGLYSPPRSASGEERLFKIVTFIHSLLARDPSLTVVEGFSFGSKGSSLDETHGLGWLVRMTMWKRGNRYLIVPPTVLKKFVTGAGTAKKNVMLLELYKRFGISVNDDNIGDAYGLSYIGRALEGFWEPTTQNQRDVIEKLEPR